MGSRIKLIALDIDGVISRGKSSHISTEIINILSEINIKAFKDKTFPPATVITGRPGPYIEAFLQAIKGFAPAVFEQGTGLYNPQNYVFEKHPDLGNFADFESLKDLIKRDFVYPGIAVMQPGKEYTISLYSLDKELNFRLKDMIIEKAGSEVCGKFDFIYSSDSLNIMPAGFHKGKGIELLSAASGAALPDILGVGDSAVDIPFMLKTGYSAAPANSGDDVKKIAGYCSPEHDSDGLIDILNHFSLIP